MSKYNSRFKLTPMPATNRWRKIYRGQIYYVGIGNCSSKTDREGYAIAIEEWRKQKDKLDAPTPDQLKLAKGVEDLRDNPAVEVITPGEPIINRTRVMLDENVVIACQKVSKRRKVGTIGFHTAAFLKIKKSRYTLGDLSGVRVENIAQHLRHIETVLGADSPVADLKEESVIQYRAALVEEISKGNIGKITAATRMSLFREWVKSVYAIEQPRNLYSRDLAIKKPVKAVVCFSVQEVKDLLSQVPEKFRLYVLLMLNCGMYQGDISDLKPSEVDWENGKITRKRSKTSNDPDAPTTTYRLWQETVRLLRKYGKSSGERVFYNRDGKPLCFRDFKPNGKFLTADAIYDQYRRRFTNKDRKPLKAFRKTGATILDGHEVYGRYVEHYLAHKPSTITSRHYRIPNQEQFDNAIKWLGEQFGIE